MRISELIDNYINFNIETLHNQSLGGGSESHFEARNLEIIEGGSSRAVDNQPEATAVTLDLDTTTSVI